MTEHPAGKGPGTGYRLVLVTFSTLISMTVFWLIMPNQFADPFLRSDDFPALFGDSRAFYWKTLTEGRWLNYVWHLRPWPFDRHLLFFLYMLLWSLTFSLTSAAIFREDRQVWRIAVVGFALAAMPQGGLIAGWPNTLVPANALLALYAGIVAFASTRVAILALALFVPLIITAYTTYPILLLAIAFVGIDWRDQPMWRPLHFGLLFCVFFIIGVLTMYALNWVAHGHFGIQIPPWREANEASSLSEIWSNLMEMGPWWTDAANIMTIVGEPSWPAFALLIVVAGLGLIRGQRTAFAAVIIGLGVSIGFILAQRGLTGVTLPLRSTGMLWVLFIGLLAMAWRVSPTTVRSAVFAGVIVMQAGLAGYGAWSSPYTGDIAEYQRETSQQADMIRSHLDAPPVQVVYVGNGFSVPHSSVLQHSIGHNFRLKSLTGWDFVNCDHRTFAEPVDIPADAKPLTIDPYYVDWDDIFGVAEQCEQFGDALRGGATFPMEGWVRPLGDGFAGVAFGPDNLAETQLPPEGL